MIRIVKAWFDVFAARLELWASEVSQQAKSVEEREYWRGYCDGLRDAPHTRPFDRVRGSERQQ